MHYWRRSHLAILLSALVLLGALGGCDDVAVLSVEQFIERAEKHRRNGDFRASIIELKNALQKEPGNPYARLLLGQSYLAVGDMAGAEKELLRAREFGASAAETMQPLGRVWLRQGKFTKVVTEIEAGEAASSAHKGAVLMMRGTAFTALNRLSEAAKEFRGVLAVDPGNAPALVGLARIALRRKDDAEAERIVAKALQTAPRLFEAIALKGDIHFARGEYRAAEAAYGKLLSLRPDDTTARMAVAQAQMALGRTSQAVEHLEAVLKQAPGHLDANYFRARAALRARDYAAAKRHSERVLAGNATHASSRLIAGTASYALGDFEQAHRHLRVAISYAPSGETGRIIGAAAERLLKATRARLAPGDADIAVTTRPQGPTADEIRLLTAIDAGTRRKTDRAAGAALFHEMDAANGEPAREDRDAKSAPDDARSALERAMMADPGAVGPRVELGRFHLEAGDPTRAIAVAEGLLRTHPDDPALLATVGLARLALGRARDARPIFAALVRTRPASTAARYLLALTYRDANDASGYRTQLERILETAPTYTPAKLALARLLAGQGSLAHATKLLEDMRKSAADDADVMELDGGVALLQGRVSSAVQAFEEAAERRPTGALALKLSLARRRAGDLEGSRLTLEQWLERSPADRRVRLALADQYLSLNRLKAARSAFEDVISAAPDYLPAIGNLAAIHLRLGDPAAALPLAERAFGLAPRNAGVLDTYGLALLGAGRAREAMTVLLRAAKAEPENKQIQSHLARALAKQGDTAAARDILRQILSGSASFPDRARAEALFRELGG